MTTSEPPQEPEVKPYKTSRRIPPLVTAGLLFIFPAFHGVAQMRREAQQTADAASTGDHFMEALNAQRYDDAFAILTPEAQTSTTLKQLRICTESMQSTQQTVIYRRDPDVVTATFSNLKLIILRYHVQSKTGEKTLVLDITPTESGMMIDSYDYEPQDPAS
ncbi:hypothetical protein CCAX7_27780 [Capsulimonas corticalis]|uniref:Uncharacterized protein n=1 Tax=Capsulimonas corticalis TaxID=2219043 RepID=A0A402CTG0_9BACT|nr:hypothetical protein [Capsulimonas corticalis]BDI30727.1 hypothetical protein CCAX7_27780 [Capsulimonas corticalis]